MRLSGKVSIITGAGSGIGRASAILFAKEGSRVAVADVRANEGEQTASRIRSNGGDAIFVKVDVSNTNEVQEMIGASVDRWGKLDIMFNNAGISKSNSIAEFDENDWERVIRVNLTGVFLGSKYAFRQFVKQRTGGSIVNTSSIHGLATQAGGCAYSASKSGVIGLTRALALDGGPLGIRANCICPGFILTPMTDHYSEAEMARYARIYPLLRMGEPNEVAQAAVFLASDESSFITGCALTVDGGLTAANPEVGVKSLE